MKPQISRYILLVLLLIGALLGVFVFAPILRLEWFIGGFLGLLCGVLLSFLFPGIREEYKEQNQKYYSDGRLSLWQYLIHPIQLPATFGLLYFIIFLFTTLLFVHPTNIDQTTYGLLPIFILFGVGGMAKTFRKEYFTGKYYLVRGKSAILLGIIQMSFFWGLSLLLILSVIFKW